jgi:hypothetical protein
MNRELLETPFTPAQIKQRKGRNGMLDYVEGHSVIQRLNEALEGAWSFEIVQHEVREDEVLVLAKLSAEGLVKMNFGVSQVTRERESGALVSLGDDLKAAATDAAPDAGGGACSTSPAECSRCFIASGSPRWRSWGSSSRSTCR